MITGEIYGIMWSKELLFLVIMINKIKVHKTTTIPRIPTKNKIGNKFLMNRMNKISNLNKAANGSKNQTSIE